MTLERRMDRHRCDATQYKTWVLSGSVGTCPHRCCSIQIITRNNYSVFEIEPYPCNTKTELCLREGNIQIQYKNSIGTLCINKYIAGALARAGGRVNYDKQYRKQHYKENVETMREQSKQYYKANSAKVAARNGVKHHCAVCAGRYIHNHRARHFRSPKHQRAMQCATQASAHHDS